jgi:hypothetical protein
MGKYRYHPAPFISRAIERWKERDGERTDSPFVADYISDSRCLRVRLLSLRENKYAPLDITRHAKERMGVGTWMCEMA